MQKRELRINFQRSVTAGTPSVMEVAVAPLSEPSAPRLDATLVGGTQSQSVLLANENNPAFFQLVPTDHPELTQRVTYRIAWREKYLGRQFTKDFVMPDFNVDFDDLENMGHIIGGTTYLQWSDRSNPGGVAALNDAGQVVDSDGNLVSGAESAAAVQGHLDAEVVSRQQGDNFLRTYFLQFAQDQIAQVYTTTATQLQAAVAQLQNADTTEKAQRQGAIVTVNNTIAALQTATNTQISNLNDLIDQYNLQFATKADLVGGKIPSSQLPDISLGKAVPVANQAAMLALTTTQVQPGDFAVRPDGVYFLNASPPSVLANWIQFTVAASVLSINGQTGAVVLNAANVGARSSSAPVPLADVSGLIGALAGKTDNAATTALTGRVTAIETDTTYVKRVGGLILRADMPVDAAFINSSNLLTKKDGSIILTGGGGALDIADVAGLQAALDAKLPTTDPSVTNPRIPTAHKASHATGGTDELTPADIGARPAATPVPITDISGLQAILTNNALTSTSDLDGRVSSAETRIENLELGAPGGGGTGASGKTVWWSAIGPISPVDPSTGTDGILLRSPFGKAVAGNYYYNPAGVDPGEAVWPYVTPNGHLKFVARNESAPADEPLATQAAFDILTALVNTKASQGSLDALSAAVDTKATLAALSTLSATVDTKASLTQLNAANDAIALRATQTAFDTLVAEVNLKATQADLTALTTTVNTKATQVSVDSLTSRVGNVETGKADLTGGKVPVAQIPLGIPADHITGIEATLTTKADLVGGKVPSAQLPDYPTSKVTGLDATLALKADLVDGKVPTSQIPAQAFHTVVSVANRGAMLALTTAQVQAGDVAVITATIDKGSYILGPTGDPSSYANWTKLTVPDDTVQSVNGQSGTVVLSAADVGARSSAAMIPQSDITNLTTALSSKADSSALTAGLATKTGTADVQTMLTDSVMFKQKVDLAATAAVASISGQQSIDGTLAPLGAVVLLTAQSSSVNNGLWIVNSGAWTRVADMAAGNYFVRGSALVVTGGANHANSIWQETNNSGVVGTNANNWTKILTAGAPPAYTASLGVNKIGNDFRAAVVTGGGIQAVSGGLQLDPNVAVRKFAGDVPSGSTIATITHNLNTTDITSLTVRDKANGDVVLVGWKPTGVNTISVEFDAAPTSGQWRAVVSG